MRAITVRQPWAWAIIHGGKDVENRSRNIAGAYRGPVAIHAGLAFDADAVPVLARLVPTWDAPITNGDPWQHRPDGVRGAILGMVDLVDVHDGLGAEHDGAPCSPWAIRYHHHLVMVNPRPLAQPLPWRGALGLWALPDHVMPTWAWGGVA